MAVTFFLRTFAREFLNTPMTETFLVSSLLVALAMALLCVKLIVRRDGHFSSMHIHDSEAMRQRGIHCVVDQDREERERKRVCRVKSES